MKTAKDVFLTIFLFSRSPNRQKLHFLALLVCLVKRFLMRFSIATSPIVAATSFPLPLEKSWIRPCSGQETCDFDSLDFCEPFGEISRAKSGG